MAVCRIASPWEGSLSLVSEASAGRSSRIQKTRKHRSYTKYPTLGFAAQTSFSCIFICPAATWHHHLDAVGHFRINLPETKYTNLSINLALPVFTISVNTASKNKARNLDSTFCPFASHVQSICHSFHF